MKTTLLFSVLFFASSLLASVSAVNNLPSDTISQVSKDSVKTKPFSRVDENGIYFATEQMPQFPGGDKALMEYMSANLHRPAGLDPIKGRVEVRFVISETGKTCQIEIKRSLHPLFDAEVVRVIQAMPDWIPGKHEGKAVPVHYTLPVTFK